MQSGIELFKGFCEMLEIQSQRREKKPRPASVGIPKAHCLLFGNIYTNKYICMYFHHISLPEISLTCHQIYLCSTYRSMILHKFTDDINLHHDNPVLKYLFMHLSAILYIVFRILPQSPPWEGAHTNQMERPLLVCRASTPSPHTLGA